MTRVRFYGTRKRMENQPPEKNLLILRLRPEALVNPGFLEELAAFFRSPPEPLKVRDIPVIHWNLPTEVLARASHRGFSLFLKKRLQTGGSSGQGDRLLFTGYRGYPHRFLNKNQIKEDYFAARDFLDGFLKDASGRQRYFPFYPDFHREELRAFYDLHGPLYLQREKERLLLAIPERNLFMPLTRAGGESGPEIQAFFRTAAGENPGALLLEIQSPEDLAILRETVELNGLPREGGGIFGRIEDIIRNPGRGMTNFKDFPAFADSGEEELPPEAFFSSSWRKFYTLMERKKDVPPELPERVFIADMLGSVAMEGDEFFAHFERGRFSGLSRKGKSQRGGSFSGKVLLPRKTSAWGFSAVGGKITAVSKAAYSTDAEDFRGLREIIRFAADDRIAANDRTAADSRTAADGREPAAPAGERRKDGSLSMEYSFHRSYPQLLVFGRLEMPDIPGDLRINSYSLLEFPIADMPGNDFAVKIIVKSSFPESQEEILLSSRSGCVPGSVLHLEGRYFEFSMGGNSVVVEVAGDEKPFLLSAQVKKKFGRLSLWINPLGSYLPVSGKELSGLREGFSFSLWAGETSALAFLKPVPGKIFKTIPGYATSLG